MSTIMYCKIGNGSDINARQSANSTSSLLYRVPHGEKFTVVDDTDDNGYVLGYPTSYRSRANAHVLRTHLQTQVPSMDHTTSANCFGPRKLESGCFGRYVKNLQKALQVAGFFPYSIDGDFGPQTETAVRSFQQDKQLAVDGVAGTNTLTYLWTIARTELCLYGY